MSKLTKPMPSQQEYEERFLYRDGNLYNKISIGRVKAGSKAGTLSIDPKTGKQYWRIQFKGKTYRAHRITWILHGYLLEPNQEIDHIDGNGLNNDINNLRACTSKQNKENLKGAYKNSKSGIRGVCWDKKSNKWRAQITHNGKGIYLGLYVTKEEAEKVVIAARKELFTHSNN